MKRIWIVLGVLVLVVVVGGGAFWAGMAYGKSQARQELTERIQERFSNRGGQFPGAGLLSQGGQGKATQFGGGIRGTIQAIEGETLKVAPNQGQRAH